MLRCYENMAAANGGLRLLGRQLLGRNWALFRRNYSNGEGLHLTFASPTEAFYNGVTVRQVDVSSTTGSFGILANHVPSIAVLKPGLVNVYETESVTSKYFVSGGSVTINADSTVQILAEEAYPLDQFDLQAAKQGLEQNQQQLTSASSEQAKAEAQIGIDLYEALIKALES